MSVYTVGEHRVRHGDIADEAGILGLVGGAKADIYYSDPPWANLKYWDTLNKKMNTSHAPVKVLNDMAFLEIIFKHASTFTDGWVVIEFGKKWSKRVVEVGMSYDLRYCGMVEALYGSPKRPLDIVFFHTGMAPNIDLSKVYHLSGYNCVREIFNLLGADGGIGMDLCCGMGYTAQACVDNGMRFIGNELNRARLDKTIGRLQRGIKNG